jgi:hypothetical protein
MIAALVLFFPTGKWKHKIPGYLVGQFQAQVQTHSQTQYHPKLLYSALLVYFVIQLWLPVRHHFIPGDVSITEEGHRMAWRMMLRSKHGSARFTVVDKKTGESQVVDPNQYLTTKQAFKMGGRPDMIWQFTQYLQKKYAEQGITDIEIYVNARANLNGTPIDVLVDPEVDLLSVKWKRFGHNSWIVADN